MGGNEGGGGRGLDRWSLFDARPTVQKSPTDPGSDSNTSGEKQKANESVRRVSSVYADVNSGVVGSHWVIPYIYL